jgi:hypothetical protein
VDNRTLITLILGGLFTISAHLLLQWNGRLRKARALRESILVEADELKYRLAFTAFPLLVRSQRLNRQLLEWLEPILAGYRGVHTRPELLDALRQMKSYPDDQLGQLFSRYRDPSKFMGVKSLDVPVLSSRAGELSLLPSEFQRSALEVLTRVGMINEEIHSANEGFRRTFDTSIVGANRVRLVENVERSLQTVARLAQQLVGLIDQLSRSR